MIKSYYCTIFTEVILTSRAVYILLRVCSVASAAPRRKKFCIWLNAVECREVCVWPPGLQYFDAHVVMNTLILNVVLTRATGCCGIKIKLLGRKPKRATRLTPVKERHKGLFCAHSDYDYFFHNWNVLWLKIALKMNTWWGVNCDSRHLCECKQIICGLIQIRWVMVICSCWPVFDKWRIQMINSRYLRMNTPLKLFLPSAHLPPSFSTVRLFSLSLSFPSPQPTSRRE